MRSSPPPQRSTAARRMFVAGVTTEPEPDEPPLQAASAASAAARQARCTLMWGPRGLRRLGAEVYQATGARLERAETGGAEVVAFDSLRPPSSPSGSGSPSS